MKDGLLGDTIRRARMDNKMTQEQLAEAINISPTHMKHIESEHRKPSVEVLFFRKEISLKTTGFQVESRCTNVEGREKHEEKSFITYISTYCYSDICTSQ